MSWREIAEAVAREATYRAGREIGRGRFNLMSARSAVRYNLLLILILTMMSASVGLSAIGGREATLSLIVWLFLTELMMGTFSIALTVQVIISDGLLSPLQHLPVDEGDLRRALSLLGIYWGGLALPFTMIPAGLVSSLILGDPSPFLGFSSASIFAMLLSIALGYLAGSFAGKYTRSVLRRAFSTLIWVMILGAGLAMSFLGRPPAYLPAVGDIAILPPISFLHIGEPLPSISSLASTALSIALLRLGTSRFWRAISSAGVEAPLKATWSISFGSRAFLIKEVKLIFRNPRMLASLLVYSFLLPLVFVIPILENIGELEDPEGILPLVPMMLGLLQGCFAPYYLYIVEAAGAEVLYSLPMTRRGIASMKAGSYLVLTMPIGLGITSALIYLLGLNVISSPLYLAALVGSTYLNSLTYALMLPREPAHWSSETFSRSMIGALMFVEVLFYLLMIMLALLLPISPITLAIAYVAVIYALSLLLAGRMGRIPL